ncbi:MAG: adenylyl-sulfate kinase [Halieaceae bacterium]|nr:adenylyl-sulfate kinase [Halieaceae bacterium]
MSFNEINKTEVAWHSGHVQPQDRQQLLGQKPLTLWLTGLSASGKSTVAFALEQTLTNLGHVAYVLDGDNVRHGLNSDLGFSHEDRTENIRRIAEVAKLMNSAGLIVITAFISPYIEDRELAKKIIGHESFMEVYVSTPIKECEARDPKGMYMRARAGGLSEFTGVNAPYEPPLIPDLIIDTSTQKLMECVDKLLVGLISRITLSESKMQLNRTHINEQ